MAGAAKDVGAVVDGMPDVPDATISPLLMQYRSLCRARLRDRLADEARFIPPDTVMIIASPVSPAALTPIVQQVAWTAAAYLDDQRLPQVGSHGHVEWLPFTAKELDEQITEAVNWAWKSSDLRNQAHLPMAF